jgi:hypothetical protein
MSCKKINLEARIISDLSRDLCVAAVLKHGYRVEELSHRYKTLLLKKGTDTYVVFNYMKQGTRFVVASDVYECLYEEKP